MNAHALLPFACLLAACAAAPRSVPADAVLSVRVDGFVTSEGITWATWPNRVEEALGGLPGITEVRVDLGDDRFDLRYDPARTGPAAIAAAIRALDYEPSFVERPVEAAEPLARVDLAALPPEVRALFDRARRSERAVLLDFFGPGWSACERMDAVTHPHPDVRAELTRWVEGRIDIAADKVSPRSFEVVAVPTAIAVTADGRVLDRRAGFVEPVEFAGWLITQRKSR